MRKNIQLLFYICIIGLSIQSSCKKDKIEKPTTNGSCESTPDMVTIQLDEKVGSSDLVFNTTTYTNLFGNNYTVNKLKYLISDIIILTENGEVAVKNYHYRDFDSSATKSLQFTLSSISGKGNMTGIKFKFGFDSTDNYMIYPDLNKVVWNWPSPIGGGYHNMQLEGNYTDTAGSNKSFATHMGTAINPSTMAKENHHVQYNFAVTPVPLTTTSKIHIIMDVNQWYENPYTWDFNKYNNGIMPNYHAQQHLYDNAPSVFSVSIE